MWPDQLSNPGPLALESDVLPSALHGPAEQSWWFSSTQCFIPSFKAVGLLMQVKRFLKVFTIYGWLCAQRFVSASSRGSIRNMKSFKNVDGRRQVTKPTYFNELNGTRAASMCLSSLSVLFFI